MKGTEKIIAHIRADAREQAEAIIAKAEQQCAAIREEYEQKAAEQYGAKIRAGVKACQDRVDSMDRIAGMEARKGLLSLKQEMVSLSFDKALAQLVSLPEEKYVALLAKLASKAAVSGDEEIVLNARDKAAIGAKLLEAANALLGEKGRLSICDETGSFAGGLVMRRGNVEANCTAELLIELCRADMAAELAGVLFE